MGLQVADKPVADGSESRTLLNWRAATGYRRIDWYNQALVWPVD